MGSGVIDGNVLAVLITLVALGMAATFLQTLQAKRSVEIGSAEMKRTVDLMSQKLDLLWNVSPFKNPRDGGPGCEHCMGAPRRTLRVIARRPRR